MAIEIDQYVSQGVSLASGATVWIYWLIIIGIILAIIGFIVHYFSYNCKIVIKERIGQEFGFDSAIRVMKGMEQKSPLNRFNIALGKFDKKPEQHHKKELKAIPTITRYYRGKIVKTRDKYILKVYRMLRKPLRLKVFGQQFWNFTGNSKKRLELLKLSEHIFAPLVTIFDDKVYQKAVIDETYIEWVVNDIEEDNKKYQQLTWWDRYGTFVLTAMTFMLCLIFVAVVFQNMNEFAEAGKQGAEVLANACTKVTTQTIP